VTLPEDGVYDAEISGAVGGIEVNVPRGWGAGDLRTALVAATWSASGAGGNVYTTPGYDSAESRVNLKVGLALGGVTVRRK